MIRKPLPVLNAAGAVAGHATTTAHLQAAKLAGVASVQQEFRPVDGVRRLCWIPARARKAAA